MFTCTRICNVKFLLDYKTKKAYILETSKMRYANDTHADADIN